MKKVLALVLTAVIILSGLLSGQLEVSAADAAKKQMIAYYKFDGDLKDASGLNNDGTAVGNITFVEGKAGKAAKFDGKSYITVKYNDTLKFNNSFTVSIWMNRDASNISPAEHVFAVGDYFKQYNFQNYPHLVFDNASIKSSFRADKTIGKNKWQLVTVTWDGKELKHYIDGVLSGESEITITLSNTSSDLYIGYHPNPSFPMFVGLMDEIRVFNYALYDYEVAALYSEISGEKAPIDETVDIKTTAAVNDGLVAYYSFDDGLRDDALKGNTAAAIGNITYGHGVAGPAAVFDGSSYIEVEGTDALDLSGGKYSLNVWIYKEDIRPDRYQPILNKPGSSIDESRPAYTISDMDNIPYVNIWDAYENYAYVEASKPIDIHKWTMLTVTYDGSSLRHYYDGVLKSSQQIKGSVPASDGKLQIGYNEADGSCFFKGKMDDLRLYNRVLSQQEITTLYNDVLNGPGRFVLNRPLILAARYMFEDNLKDSFGNGHDGIAVGNITFDTGRVGKAAKFDGSGYIEIKDSDLLDVSNGFTFSAWVYKEGQNREYPILNKAGSSTDIDRPSYVFADRDMYPYVCMFDEHTNFVALESPTKLDVSKWTLVTVTFDGKSVKYYYNGVLQGSKDGVFNVPNSSGPLQIGFNSLDGPSFFKGKIDDLRIYTKALTPDQVQSLYAMYGQ